MTFLTVGGREGLKSQGRRCGRTWSRSRSAASGRRAPRRPARPVSRGPARPAQPARSLSRAAAIITPPHFFSRAECWVERDRLRSGRDGQVHPRRSEQGREDLHRTADVPGARSAPPPPPPSPAATPARRVCWWHARPDATGHTRAAAGPGHGALPAHSGHRHAAHGDRAGRCCGRGAAGSPGPAARVGQGGREQLCNAG